MHPGVGVGLTAHQLSPCFSQQHSEKPSLCRTLVCPWDCRVPGTALFRWDPRWVERPCCGGPKERVRGSGAACARGRKVLPRSELRRAFLLDLAVPWPSSASLSRTSRASGCWFPHTCLGLDVDPWRTRQPPAASLKTVSGVPSRPHTPCLCAHCSLGLGALPNSSRPQSKCCCF